MIEKDPKTIRAEFGNHSWQFLVKGAEQAQKGEALDLGNGRFFKETEFLLRQGFAHVTAVDINPDSENSTASFPKERFSFHQSAFATYGFPKDRFDMVNARFSLFFNPAATYVRMFASMVDSIRSGGILNVTFLGPNDSWKSETDRKHPVVTHTKEDIRKLLADFDIIDLDEVEMDGLTRENYRKHWHVFNVLAKKK